MKDNFLFKGLSNDRVSLICDSKNKDEKFIRKTAFDDNKSSRLEDQYNYIQNWGHEYIKVPKILNCGSFKEKRFFYDMEYINFPSFSHIVNHSSHENIAKSKKGSQLLLNYLKEGINDQILPGKNHLIFLINNKLKDLNKFFKKKHEKKLRSEIIKYIEYLMQITEQIIIKNNFKKVSTLSYKIHGDLTLSNMLMSENVLYFIDINSHFIGQNILSDISKIIFDLDFCLSIKLENNNMYPDLSVLNFLSNLKKNILNITFKKVNYYASIKDLLLIVESLRVLQYVCDNKNKVSNNLQLYIIDKFDSLLKENFLCQL